MSTTIQAEPSAFEEAVKDKVWKDVIDCEKRCMGCSSETEGKICDDFKVVIEDQAWG